MKKKFITILLVFFTTILTLSSCKSKKIENLEIHTINNGVTSLNPILSWDSNNSDKYIIIIEDNISKETIKNVSSPFSLGGYLDNDTEYTVTVKDKFNHKDSITFKTMKDGGNMKDSLNTFLMVQGAYYDNMVIQKDKPFIIRGIAKKGVQVSVIIDNIEIYSAISNNEWEITIPGHTGGLEEHSIKVVASNDNFVEFKRILFGDVFLVAGQSNMQWPIKDADYLESDLDIDSNRVRFFAQASNTKLNPSTTFTNHHWFKYDKNDEGNQLYSAIGLMLGSMLSKELKDSNIPIGIMYAAQGDTHISKWIDKEFYNGKDSDAGVYYNAMINPFKGLNVKGVVWYQGCNDSGQAIEYKDNLIDLFYNYRVLFNDFHLPFYVVELACFDGDEGNKFNFAYVRDSQLKACLEDDNAYIISTVDNGDPSYIHPRAKRYIAERLTKSILAVTYNYSYLKEGPTVKNITIDNNKVIVEVNNNEGLHSNTCKGFILAGNDGRFYEASATIEDGKIIVTSNKVSNPIYIRYGFSRSPFLDIYNKDGYLMSPFRNDDYDKNIELLNYEDVNLYKKDSGSDYTLVINGDNLVVHKEASEVNYCSFNLDRYSPVCHNGSKFRFVFIGSGSNAEIQVRFIEASYEIWSFTFIDDVVGENIKEVDVDSISCTYNPLNNVFNYQSIMQVGLLIKSNNEVNITIKEARFI